MTVPVGVGIVGLGFGEHVLLPAFRAHAACEVVGVAAGRPDRARAIAARERLTAYDGWQDLVGDPRVQAVVVATPPALHAPIAIAALRAGKHVFCEKPLADGLAAAGQMAAAAVAAGTANMVDFEFPDIPQWTRARQILESGALGRLRHVSVAWHVETYANRERLTNWKTAADAGGGALNDFGSHVLYYLEWLLGPIDTLWAAPQQGSGNDVLAVLSLRFRDGMSGAVTIATAAPLGDGHAVTVYGDQGALALSNRTSDYARGFTLHLGTRDGGTLQPVAVDALGSAGSDGRAIVAGRLVERFVDWMRSGTPARPSFADGLRVQTLLDLAWRSRRHSRDGYALER
ncbi:MAG TPA: Gfo/Idh/MocA family oxidoreductase [Vicinamibacterales bacterium]|nr:Gfo/Idh/MocA family oxidoreductase [Vicinamibacterales bacterium]